MRLNLYQRAGVVLTVLWVGGYWFYLQRSDNMQRYYAGSSAYNLCDHRPSTMPADCSAEFTKAADAMVPAVHTWLHLGWAMTSAVLIWLLVYGVLAVIRWVLAGRHASLRRDAPGP